MPSNSGSEPDSATHHDATQRSGHWSVDGPVAFEVALQSLERAGVGVVLLDAEMRFVFVNAVAAAINGRRAEEHIGSTMAEVLGDIGQSVVPLLQRVLFHDEPVVGHEIVGELVARPGEMRTWEGDYFPFRSTDDSVAPDAVLVVFVEVTDERRAERRLRQLIDGLFTFVGMCDVDGTLIEANEFALNAAGLERHDVIGRPFWECYWWSYDDDVKKRLRQAVADAAAGRTCRYDAVMRVAGGRLIPIDFQLVPMIEHGRVVSLVPSGIDIEARSAQIGDLSELAGLAADLHQALGMQELVDLVVDRASGIFNTSLVTLAVIGPDDGVMRVTTPVELDREVAERWSELPEDGPRTPFHDAADTREPVWVFDRSERRARYPEMADDSDRIGLVVTAAMPLCDATGVIGVLGLGWIEPIIDEPTVRLHASLFANLCAHALQRVQRTRSTMELVSNLTGELMARRDHETQLDVAVGYVPAVSEIGFGGDWFDVVTLSDSETALIVGDVVGHDVRAAAQMAVARSALRTAVLARPQLVGVSTLVTRSLGLRERQFFATALVVIVDAARGELRWKSFGHLPAAIADPDGAVTLLREAGPPIGMLTDAAPIGTRPFVPGSRLVLYTDGLVESRGQPIDERLATLAGALADAPAGSAQHLLEHLMHTLVAAAPEDDVAIITAVL